jgi:hypothetical protein
MICKEEDDLCERLFEVVWLYKTTYLLVEFKDFEMVKLSRVICPDEKYEGFFKVEKMQRFFFSSGLIEMSDLLRLKIQRFFKVVIL